MRHYMNRRLWLGILGFVVLMSLAGCTAFTGATSESGLMANASYDWETDTDVEIDLGDDAYTAVHTIEGQQRINLYQSNRYGIENPLAIRALQFRYENGTVANASEIGVSETRSAVELTLPAEDGQLAYTAPKRSKEFVTPVFTSGSYTVKVPPDHDVENFVLGTVRPRGADSEVIDGRVHLTWSDISSGSIRVNYYLERDLYLFGGLVIVGSIVAAIGIGYVYRQIQALRRKREELGLDLDMSDDDSRDPPPGMR